MALPEPGAVSEPSLPSTSLPPLPEQEPVEPPIKWWRWSIHLVLIGMYPFLGVLVRSGQHIGGPAFSDNTHDLLVVCALEIGVFSLAFALGWLASRASAEELLLHWRPGWKVVPLGVAYSIGIRLALLVVVIVIGAVLLLTKTFTPQSLQEFSDLNGPDVGSVVSVSALQSNSSYFWLTLTLVSFVIAGVREEMWRGAMLAGMRALWPGKFGSLRGQCVAITLIAILFGAMHFSMGPIAAVLAAVVGWFLGLIIIFHQSVWPAVIAHGLFDATTFAVLPWAMEKLQQLR